MITGRMLQWRGHAILPRLNGRSNMQEFLSRTYYGNTVLDWTVYTKQLA